jgi:hypothetical protein
MAPRDRHWSTHHVFFSFLPTTVPLPIYFNSSIPPLLELPSTTPSL